MKPKPLFRIAITFLAIAISVIFLEHKREANMSRIIKSNTADCFDAKNAKISNTDYIFFELISKYYFTRR